MGQKKALFAMAVEGDTSTKKPITKEAEEECGLHPFVLLL